MGLAAILVIWFQPMEKKRRRASDSASKQAGGKKGRPPDNLSSDEVATSALCRSRVSNDTVNEVLRLRGFHDVNGMSFKRKWTALRDLGLVSQSKYKSALCVRTVTIKCSLSSIAGPEFITACKQASMDATRACRRAWYIVNLLLLRAYDEGTLATEVPLLLNQTSMNNILRRTAGSRVAAVESHARMEEDFSAILPPQDLSAHTFPDQLRGNLSRRMIPALKTHWKMHYKGRLQHHLEKELEADPLFSFHSERSEGKTFKMARWDKHDLGKWYLVRQHLVDGLPSWPKAMVALLCRARDAVFLTDALKKIGDEDVDESDEEDGGRRGARVPWADLARSHISLSKERERRGEKTFGAAPVGSRGATYITIDTRLSEHPLFKDKGFELGTCLDVLRSARKARRRWIRRGLRKCKKSNGTGSTGGLYEVSSISTDGEGCSICVKREVRERTRVVEPKDEAVSLHSRLLEKHGSVRIVGVDPGRRNLFFSSEKLSDDWKNMYHRKLTREAHRKMSGQLDRELWENERRETNPELREALNSLSMNCSNCCNPERLVAFIREDQRWNEVLEAEYLLPDARTQWRMQMFRLKRMTLDRCASSVTKGLGLHAGAPVVVCYGQTKMRSGGRGEAHVPVNECAQAFFRAVKNVGMGSRMVKVDEYNTTAMCHRCKRRNTKDYIVDALGARREVLAYRLCRGHRAQDDNAVVRLDRDRIGSINIGVAGEAFVRGEPRPAYLCRPNQ